MLCVSCLKADSIDDGRVKVVVVGVGGRPSGLALPGTPSALR
jgi:hypothetical protein